MILAQSLRDSVRPIFLLDSEDLWCREQLDNQGCEFFSGGCDSAWICLPEPDALLIDSRISDGLERLIATAKCRRIPVISIHDMGLNPLPSDVVFDGSLVPSFFQDAFLPNAGTSSSMRFSGTDFMILDPAFTSIRREGVRIKENIGTILINLGGGDSRTYFPVILEGLRQWASEPVEVIGLRGFARWGQDELAQRDWHPLRFRWECGSPHQYLFRADLAITAGGISAYEALCSGTPLLALSYDPLQQATINAIEAAGACISLGPGDSLEATRLAGLLSTMNAGREERRRISLNGRKTVDGRGAERVAHVVRQLIRGRTATGNRETVA